MILSHTNIEKSIISFLNDSEEVILFSAYIRSEQLKKINQKTNVKQIVVRWEISDLCFGASDLELYNYCKENNIITTPAAILNSLVRNKSMLPTAEAVAPKIMKTNEKPRENKIVLKALIGKSCVISPVARTL